MKELKVSWAVADVDIRQCNLNISGWLAQQVISSFISFAGAVVYAPTWSQLHQHKGVGLNS